MSEYAPQKPKNDDAVGVILFAAYVYATCMSPFFRSGFGREALGWKGFLAFMLMLMVGASGAAGMGTYMAVWLCMVIYRRLETFRLIRKGYVIHSRYCGYPWLAMRVPFVRTEETARGFWEPMICFLSGGMLCPWSQNVGGFVMLGALALMICNGIEREIVRKRTERMQDARIEADFYSGQVQ